ncbi:hypothetical protein PAXINDRAFT_50108, partial [Paxillus involutus ATCC 200175]
VPPLVLLGHRDSIWSVACLPDGERVISGSEDGSVRAWRAQDGRGVVEWEGHSSSVWTLGFSVDSARLVSGSRDGSVVVWSTTTGKRLVGPLTGHTGWVFCASFSPQGDEIASCDSRDVRIWNSHSPNRAVEDPHINIIRSITVSPNGKFIASGSPDHTVRLWDTTTRQQIGPVLQHDDAVHSVAISP